MKGYAKAKLTKDEIIKITELTNKAYDFVDTYSSSNYKTKKVTSRRWWFDKVECDHDWEKESREINESGCEYDYSGHSYNFVDVKPELKALKKVLSLGSNGDMYLDDELCKALNDFRTS